MRMRRVLLLTAVTAALLGAAGCTPPAPAPTPPSVSWSPAPPSGEHEDSPWVEALRASDAALAIASVTRDYTAADLGRTTTDSKVRRSADAQRRAAKKDDFYAYPGPTPMTVLSVEETGRAGATVMVCEAGNWYVESRKQPTAPTTLEGAIVEYRLVRGDDDTIRVDMSIPHTDSACDLGEVAVGRFDPQPDVSKGYSPSDVKGP